MANREEVEREVEELVKDWPLKAMERVWGGDYERRVAASNGHDFGPILELSARCRKCKKWFSVLVILGFSSSGEKLPPCMVM